MLLLPRGINSGQHNSPRPMNASQDDGDAGSGRPRRDEIAVDGYAVTDTRDQLVVGERPAASVVRGVTDENGGGGGGDCKSRMAGERELNLGTRTSASSDPRERIMFRGTAVSDSPAEAADGMCCIFSIYII
ncbi:uncharacterized protein LOC111042815 [Myzus persicae]|uniref:uncharacterized protein LOC111042815 n=1 Tax=Myzus persicae TaxID=13164 RepID=UPI000B936F2B|nr:uncharacterized protein LOC111042815 [Myzus persicae]